jgi:hypothetical protein
MTTRTRIAAYALLGIIATAAWAGAASQDGGPATSLVAAPKLLWQADIQVKVLEVMKAPGSLAVRVVVTNENSDEAFDARLLIFIPVGAGLERMPAGCTAGPGPAMVPSLRGVVQCALGNVPARAISEITITTTVPPAGLAKRFGVFAYSSTPDPKPSNNYAERLIP